MHYIDRETFVEGISEKYPPKRKPRTNVGNPPAGGQTMTEPAEATVAQEVNHAAKQEKIPKPIRTG